MYYEGLEKEIEQMNKVIEESIIQEQKEKNNKFNNSFAGRLYWFATGKIKGE